jgi:hypothetical protein
MTSNCCDVQHRTIEGVLTYLNAFLLLDYARDITGTNKLLGVVVLLVVTVIALWYMRRHCLTTGGSSCSQGPIMVPPSPEEGFARRKAPDERVGVTMRDAAYSSRSYGSAARR